MLKKIALSAVIVAAMTTVATALEPNEIHLPAPHINEFVVAHTWEDTREFVEVFGAASQDFSDLTIVVLEGDVADGIGTIDFIRTVGTTDSNGIWSTGFLPQDSLEGDVSQSLTILLVEGLLGTAIVGNDLDTNDDGTLDETPWIAIHDDVAVDDGGAGDVFYSTTVLSAAMAPTNNSFPPGGASRIPDGIDTNSANDWWRNDWNLAGIEEGTPEDGEAYNTPGENNLVIATAVINEIVIDHAGAPDDHQYIEVAGYPAADYSAYSLVVIDGDAGVAGSVDQVYALTAANSEGYWTTGFLVGAEILEAGSTTVLLVEAFSGSEGSDLDTNDDGTLDSTPWTAILDSVSISDGDGGDYAYSSVVLDTTFDAVGTVPGGISRVPDFTDSDAVADWKRNDFDGEGLGIGGSITAGEAYNTPGRHNRITVFDYYANVVTTSPGEIRATLHDTINDHKRFPYTGPSDDSIIETWEILEAKQVDPSNSLNFVDVYKNETEPATGEFSGSHDREHSWPKSLGVGTDTDSYQYSDCHHLFLAASSYNSARLNYSFADCVSGCSPYPADAYNGVGGAGDPNYRGTPAAGGIAWQVWNHRKGDIARAALYMDVRYEGGDHGVTGYPEPNLILVNASGGGFTMGYLSELIQWHRDDPPDAEEMAGNEAVYSYQGNRNPFIDHPEWVTCLHEGICVVPIFTAGFETGTTSEWSNQVR